MAMNRFLKGLSKGFITYKVSSKLSSFNSYQGLEIYEIEEGSYQVDKTGRVIICDMTIIEKVNAMVSRWKLSVDFDNMYFSDGEISFGLKA